MLHKIDIKRAGIPLKEAEKALIMIHGRGATAESILTLSTHLNVNDFALLAPQATQNTWYPYSFMAPTNQNEPWLTSALEIVDASVQLALENGILAENIYFFGFSQGACLTLEYLARHAQKYGGVVAIIGGLIGEKIMNDRYKGDFQQTPIFIGTSNPDTHVPIDRVYATVQIYEEMNADLTLKVYDYFEHSIHQEQINWANKLVFK